MKNNETKRHYKITRLIPHSITTITLTLLVIVLAFSSIKLYKKQIENKKEIKILETQLKEEKEKSVDAK